MPLSDTAAAAVEKDLINAALLLPPPQRISPLLGYTIFGKISNISWLHTYKICQLKIKKKLIFPDGLLVPFHKGIIYEEIPTD